MAKVPRLVRRADEVLGQFRRGEIEPRAVASYQRFLEHVNRLEGELDEDLLARVVAPRRAPASAELALKEAGDERPGLSALFEHCHRDAIVDVGSAESLGLGDPFEQMVSLVRAKTHGPLRHLIMDLWQSVELPLQQGVFPISDRNPVWPSVWGVGVVDGCVVVDENFAQAFECDHPDEVVVRLKRLLVAFMAEHLGPWWEARGGDEAHGDLVRSLALRGLRPSQVLTHGWNAAVAVTLNSLLVLFDLVGEKVGGKERSPWPKVSESTDLISSNAAFLLTLSRFNLNSFAAFCRLVHRPEVPEIPEAGAPVPSEGFVVDRLFDARFFTLRRVEDEPWLLDVKLEALDEEAQADLWSAALRRGCPASAVNPRLVELLGDLFLRAVSPFLAKG